MSITTYFRHSNIVFLSSVLFSIIIFVGCKPDDNKSNLTLCPDEVSSYTFSENDNIPSGWIISSESDPEKPEFSKTNWIENNILKTERGILLGINKKISEKNNRTDYYGAQLKHYCYSQYGQYRAIMKVADIRGTIQAFFVYSNSDPSNVNTINNEIDIEIMRDKNNVYFALFSTWNGSYQIGQTTRNKDGEYYTESQNQTRITYTLPSDKINGVQKKYYEYGFDWYPDKVDFYFNGKKVGFLEKTIPQKQAKIYFNHWIYENNNTQDRNYAYIWPETGNRGPGMYQNNYDVNNGLVIKSVKYCPLSRNCEENSFQPRVGLLVNNAAKLDAEEQRAYDFATNAGYAISLIDPSILLNQKKDLSSIDGYWSDNGSIPSGYSASKVNKILQKEIASGKRIFCTFWGRYICAYITGDTPSYIPYGNVVNDSHYFVSGKSNLGFFDGIEQWTPNSGPDNPNQLIYSMNVGGNNVIVFINRNGPVWPNEKFISTYNTPGWYGLNPNSGLCSFYKGYCSNQRIIDNSLLLYKKKFGSGWLFAFEGAMGFTQAKLGPAGVKIYQNILKNIINHSN